MGELQPTCLWSESVKTLIKSWEISSLCYVNPLRSYWWWSGQNWALGTYCFDGELTKNCRYCGEWWEYKWGGIKVEQRLEILLKSNRLPTARRWVRGSSLDERTRSLVSFVALFRISSRSWSVVGGTAFLHMQTVPIIGISMSNTEGVQVERRKELLRLLKHEEYHSLSRTFAFSQSVNSDSLWNFKKLFQLYGCSLKKKGK